MSDSGSSTPPVEDAVLIKVPALAKYNTLVLKANNFPSDKNHQKKFLSITQEVLGSYPTTGKGGPPAELPRNFDVIMTIRSLLEPPAMTFMAKYFNEALGLIIVLHKIACFYGFGTVDSDFNIELNLSSLEESSSSYGTQTWFVYIHDLSTMILVLSYTSISQHTKVPTLDCCPRFGSRNCSYTHRSKC
eukprot:IDg17816t1